MNLRTKIRKKLLNVRINISDLLQYIKLFGIAGSPFSVLYCCKLNLTLCSSDKTSGHFCLYSVISGGGLCFVFFVFFLLFWKSPEPVMPNSFYIDHHIQPALFLGGLVE